MDRGGKNFMATSVTGVPQEPTAHPGEIIGIWRVAEPLGSGGMGSVYGAERADGLYEQRIALKLMAPGDARRAERFTQERQMLARLEHPGIARIIDGGTDRKDRPFIAMELVDGVPIDAYCADHDLDDRATIGLLRQLCAALAHAHGRLILHRDIKPDNVLVDHEGQLRLVDFGISASLGASDDSRICTAAYAAPEQQAGDVASIAGDVFSTGCLAHTLLAGHPPDRDRSGQVTVDRAAIADPDLAAIVSRATATDPEARYAGMAALDDDLGAWLEHRPVAARSGGTGYRLGRFVRRYPVGVALGSLAVLSLAGGLIASLVFADRARSERDRAEEALAKAEWSIERGDIFNQAQAAYSDVLQRLFGAQGDIEAQTAALTERVEEAQARADEEPDNAAFISYTIGRHFLFRNDYPSAIRILEPWVTQGYGPEGFQVYGKQLLAVAYMNSGQAEQAVPLLREVVAIFDQGFDANTPDHAAAASQLAFTTGDEGDLRTADRVLSAAQETTTEPGIRIFFWNQLATIRRMLGDLPAAREAMVEAIALIDENRLTEIAGKDTARVNLAEYEYYLRGDLERTRALIDLVMTDDAVAKGENRELGRAMVYDGMLASRAGRTHEAVSVLEEAVALTDRFAGAQSSASIHARIALAETLADDRDRDRALAVLAEADAIEDERIVEGSAVERRLARIYVLAKTGAQDRARELASSRQWSKADFTTSPRTRYRHERLREMGVMK